MDQQKPKIRLTDRARLIETRIKKDHLSISGIPIMISFIDAFTYVFNQLCKDICEGKIGIEEADERLKCLSVRFNTDLNILEFNNDNTHEFICMECIMLSYINGQHDHPETFRSYERWKTHCCINHFVN